MPGTGKSGITSDRTLYTGTNHIRMFSEKDIIRQCAECSGDCESIKFCPVKWHHSAHSSKGIIPGMWHLAPTEQVTGQSGRSDRFTTEELLKGLSKLNQFL